MATERFTGKFHGKDPMPTERESGERIEAANQGPLKSNHVGHRVLFIYYHGEAMTAYEASMKASGDWHRYRRESKRLYDRGLLDMMEYTLPNGAPGGRSVEVWRINDAGRAEMARLGTPEEAIL